MFEEILQPLVQRWKQAFGQYPALHADAEGAVSRWEWTTGERYSLLPHYFQRFPVRGRVLKEAPAGVGLFIRYGFDAQGRLRLHQTYQFRGLERFGFLHQLLIQQTGYEDLFSETFYAYSADGVEMVTFSASPHIPLQVQRISCTGGQVGLYSSFRLNGYTPLYAEKGKDPDGLYAWLGYNGRFKTVEQYGYTESRLTEILAYYEAPGSQPNSARENFTYGEDGRLFRIERLWEGGQKQVLYQKRRKDQTFQDIRQVAVQRLVGAIIERLRTAEIRERLYCVELNYQSALAHFPPVVVPVPESYRQELIRTASGKVHPDIFLPVIMEKERYLEISDPQTLEACQALEQEIQAGQKWNTATRILRELAATLTRYDWSGILDVTPDFVVFALDPELEGDNLTAVLSSSVSKDQIREWKNKGWLD